MGGDLAPNLGGTQKIFCGPISEKMSIFRVKIYDDLFLVIDLVLRIFPFFSHIFRMFTMLNVVTISSQKNHHFSLFSYFHPHPTTLLLKMLGGPMHGPSPHLKFGGTVSPVPPRSPPLAARKLS